MGAYLPKPITEKDSHDESHPEFEFGVSKMQGWRQSMEVTQPVRFFSIIYFYKILKIKFKIFIL